ncbi:hypothetical protein SELMODRAFT_414170 [Selaginella moellendorffii]|uniref:BIG2 domain-containing protein n=1 Tax=Selaginella moellendorffii TaxID=88036 RepID=D8RRW1_SELML|nr:hypothetical protein SELMODRAFT_414170 [Selaginella moellendorffii]
MTELGLLATELMESLFFVWSFAIFVDFTSQLPSLQYASLDSTISDVVFPEEQHGNVLESNHWIPTDTGGRSPGVGKDTFAANLQSHGLAKRPKLLHLEKSLKTEVSIIFPSQSPIVRVHNVTQMHAMLQQKKPKLWVVVDEGLESPWHKFNCKIHKVHHPRREIPCNGEAAHYRWRKVLNELGLVYQSDQEESVPHPPRECAPQILAAALAVSISTGARRRKQCPAHHVGIRVNAVKSNACTRRRENIVGTSFWFKLKAMRKSALSVASEHGWQNAMSLTEGAGTIVAKLVYNVDYDVKVLKLEQAVVVCPTVLIAAEHATGFHTAAEINLSSDYVWSSTNPNVASVTALGKILGKTVIRASSAKDVLIFDEIHAEVSSISVVHGLPVEVEINAILPVAMSLTTPSDFNLAKQVKLAPDVMYITVLCNGTFSVCGFIGSTYTIRHTISFKAGRKRSSQLLEGERERKFSSLARLMGADESSSLAVPTLAITSRRASEHCGESSLLVVCDVPSSIVLTIDEPDNSQHIIKSVAQLERDQERKRLVPVTVMNPRSIRVEDPWPLKYPGIVVAAATLLRQAKQFLHDAVVSILDVVDIAWIKVVPDVLTMEVKGITFSYFLLMNNVGISFEDVRVKGHQQMATVHAVIPSPPTSLQRESRFLQAEYRSQVIRRDLVDRVWQGLFLLRFVYLPTLVLKLEQAVVVCPTVLIAAEHATDFSHCISSLEPRIFTRVSVGRFSITNLYRLAVYWLISQAAEINLATNRMAADESSSLAVPIGNHTLIFRDLEGPANIVAIVLVYWLSVPGNLFSFFEMCPNNEWGRGEIRMEMMVLRGMIQNHSFNLHRERELLRDQGDANRHVSNGGCSIIDTLHRVSWQRKDAVEDIWHLDTGTYDAVVYSGNELNHEEERKNYWHATGIRYASRGIKLPFYAGILSTTTN